MNYSFEYIDIILLAMIAGFIFLRLRGILGKRTGFDGKAPAQFKEILKTVKQDQTKKTNENNQQKSLNKDNVTTSTNELQPASFSDNFTSAYECF